MKLSELCEHTREGRWSDPGAMRWILDLGSLKELVADIDDELSKAREPNPGERKINDAAKREEYWRGRKDGNAETASDLSHRVWEIGNTLRNAQDAAKAMHAEKDARIAALEHDTPKLRELIASQPSLYAKLAELGESVRLGVASDNDQYKRIAALEQLFQDAPKNTLAIYANWERRLEALEQAKVETGIPERRDLVTLDRHFDSRCDALSKRLDAMEAENERLNRVLARTPSLDAFNSMLAKVQRWTDALAKLGSVS